MGGNTEPDKLADPVTTAGILEILQIRAERKMKDVIIKAIDISIEANKAILYAS